MIARRALGIAALTACCASASEPLRVLSAGAVEPALAAALERWRAEGGGGVDVAFVTAPRSDGGAGALRLLAFLDSAASRAAMAGAGVQ